MDRFTENSQNFPKLSIRVIELNKTYAGIVIINFIILWMNITLVAKTKPDSSHRMWGRVVERVQLTAMEDTDLGPIWAPLLLICVTLGTCLRVTISSHPC